MSDRFKATFVFCLWLSACSPANKIKQSETQATQAATDNQLTLNPMPNSLDGAGLIIAIDKQGVRTSIPGGDLGLTRVAGVISIPQVVRARNMQLGTMAKFLSAAPADTSVSASVFENSSLNATFSVEQGTYTRLDGNLDSAFEAKRASIERNIKFLNLVQNRIYLVLETVSSTNIKIDIERTSHAGIDAVGSLAKWVNLHPSADKSTSIKKDIIYQDTKKPVVVLYKLISINIDKGRGNDNGSSLTASLGQPVTVPVLSQ